MGIKIKEELFSWSSMDFEGPLDDAIKTLTNKRTELKKTHTDLRVELEAEYGYYDDQWQKLVIYGYAKQSATRHIKNKKKTNSR